MKPRVLLADDDKIVAEGLARLLEPEFELVGIVEDGRQLLEAAEALNPEVVAADISMPRLNGIDAARQLKKAKPRLRIVFLTQHSDVVYAARALDAGASGYVLKHAAPEELVAAVRKALLGRTYVTPLIDEEALRAYRQHGQRRGALGQGGGGGARHLPPHRGVPQVPPHGRAGSANDGGAHPVRRPPRHRVGVITV
jgi:DNA-binding NarL/FixJ family response regulator